MVKSHKNRNNIIKNIKKTTDKALPIVNKGLKTVGETAKVVAVKSVPIIEKGVSAVYGTMATGLDLGVKGVKNVAKGLKKSHKHISHRSRKGGRTRRRHSRRH